MNDKTFLRGIAVALEPRRGGARLVVELAPKQTHDVFVSGRTYKDMRRCEQMDLLLGRQVEIDQQPPRLRIIVGDLPGPWWPTEPTALERALTLNARRLP